MRVLETNSNQTKINNFRLYKMYTYSLKTKRDQRDTHKYKILGNRRELFTTLMISLRVQFTVSPLDCRQPPRNRFLIGRMASLKHNLEILNIPINSRALTYMHSWIERWTFISIVRNINPALRYNAFTSIILKSALLLYTQYSAIIARSTHLGNSYTRTSMCIIRTSLGQRVCSHKYICIDHDSIWLNSCGVTN